MTDIYEIAEYTLKALKIAARMRLSASSAEAKR